MQVTHPNDNATSHGATVSLLSRCTPHCSDPRDAFFRTGRPMAALNQQASGTKQLRAEAQRSSRAPHSLRTEPEILDCMSPRSGAAPRELGRAADGTSVTNGVPFPRPPQADPTSSIWRTSPSSRRAHTQQPRPRRLASSQRDSSGQSWGCAGRSPFFGTRQQLASPAPPRRSASGRCSSSSTPSPSATSASPAPSSSPSPTTT